jgi:hypothetical protein
VLGQKEIKAKINIDVKSWYELRERGEAEGKAYMKKVLAKWTPDLDKWKAERKAEREEVATMLEAIDNKIDAKKDKLLVDWAKIKAGF